MYTLIILDKFLKVLMNALKRVSTHSKNGPNFGDRCMILDSILGQFWSSWWTSTHKTGFRYLLARPLDLCDKLLECRILSALLNSYIDIYNEELVIRSILNPNSGDVDKDKLAREVHMNLLAGDDCAILIIGRFFNYGVIRGFI